MSGCTVYKHMPYTKGQVWMVEEPPSVTEAWLKAGTHKQVKTRPYLIYLSNADSQLDFNVIQGFPITSNDKMTSEKPDRTFYDFDVRFKNQHGGINRVVTGQLTTIDVRYLGRYLYTLPKEAMDEIDRLIVHRFGLEEALQTVNEPEPEPELIPEPVPAKDPVIDQLESMQRQMSALLAKINALEGREPITIQNVIAAAALESSQTNEVSIQAPAEKPKEKPEPEKRAPAISAPKRPPMTHTLDADGKPERPRPPLEYTKAGRIRWTDEALLEFIEDIEKLGDAKTAKRWGFTDPRKFSSVKSYVVKKYHNIK